jgi:hypothetical protein
LSGSATAAGDGVDEAGGNPLALMVEAEDLDGRVLTAMGIGPVGTEPTPAGPADGRPLLDASAGCAAVVECLFGGWWEGLPSGAFGFFEEASGLVEFGDEGVVGVAEVVGLGVVEPEGDGGADGVAVAVAAGTGTRLSRVAVKG